MFGKRKKGNEMETLDDLYSQIGKEVKKRGIDAAIIIPVRDTLRELDGLGCAYRLIVGGKPTVGSYRAMVLARVVAIFFAAGFRNPGEEIDCRFQDLDDMERFLACCQAAVAKAAKDAGCKDLRVSPGGEGGGATPSGDDETPK
jgi:hypothetical protein